jgi:hypothetical protein
MLWNFLLSQESFQTMRTSYTVQFYLRPSDENLSLRGGKKKIQKQWKEIRGDKGTKIIVIIVTCK